jgi:hypothetical protein
MCGSAEERCEAVRSASHFDAAEMIWCEESMRRGMKDEVPVCVSLAEDRIGSELLCMARRSNEHFGLDDHTGRGGRSIVLWKLARRIV